MMQITAFWQANSCAWRTFYLASIQHSVSLQKKCDLCSQKDGARKTIKGIRQDMMFYYTRLIMEAALILHSQALNVKYFKHSDALSDSFTMHVLMPLKAGSGQIYSRVRKKPSLLWCFASCVQTETAGAAMWFQYVPKGRV